MIEELKIAVDRIKESYENKVDQMENVIFDCREREREGTCEVHDKETRQFEDKRSLSDSKNLPT